MAIRDPRISRKFTASGNPCTLALEFLSPVLFPLPAAVPAAPSETDGPCCAPEHLHCICRAAMRIRGKTNHRAHRPQQQQWRGPGVLSLFHALVMASGLRRASAQRMLSFRGSKREAKSRCPAGAEGATWNYNWNWKPSRPSRPLHRSSYQLIRTPHCSGRSRQT